MNDQPTELTKVALQSKILHGKRALIIGIANEHSIAYGCARVFRQLGADLAVTYLNEKARPYVEPLAKELGASIFAPCARPELVSMVCALKDALNWSTLAWSGKGAAPYIAL